ncbi:MAG: Zn-ribbon domain-containing OB-fold protein [Acidimicrobiales bacterium]
MPAEIELPAVLDGVELVRSVRTPAALAYTFTAGEATTRFLTGVQQKKLLGERAPGGKVYIPSRGADPQLGVPTSEQVELPHVGTLTSFCVVNVAFYGQGMEIPYTSGLILLDGADLPIMHLIQECPVDKVRIGMRVEAVWVPDDEIGPTLESIRYFKPTGEPDAEVPQPGEGVTW